MRGFTAPSCNTRHSTSGQTIRPETSWPQDTVHAGALVTFLLGVIGPSGHAPPLHSSLDIVEVGDLPSDAVMLSAPSAVLCPPPTSHRAPTWISRQRAYTTSTAGCVLRPDEISPVPQMTVPTFRSPYAGGFFEAADPESSPLPWPSRLCRRSAPSCSPCGANISTLQDSLYGTDYRVALLSQEHTALHHNRSPGSSGR